MFTVRRLGRGGGAVAGRLIAAVAVSAAEVAMDEARRLRRDENQKSERRQ